MPRKKQVRLIPQFTGHKPKNPYNLNGDGLLCLPHCGIAIKNISEARTARPNPKDILIKATHCPDFCLTFPISFSYKNLTLPLDLSIGILNLNGRRDRWRPKQS